MSDYTTNLTMPKVATMLELSQWSWMPWRQWRSSSSVLQGGCQVEAMTVEISYGPVLYDCETNDVMKDQSK